VVTDVLEEPAASIFYPKQGDSSFFKNEGSSLFGLWPLVFVLVSELLFSLNMWGVQREGVTCESDIVQGKHRVGNWNSEPVGVV
jgi:hypothetical protein